MTLSNTTSFNMDVKDIIEEAFDRVGIESRTGYELLSARRSLSLLLLEWANRGINLWTIAEHEVVLTYGVGQYTLDSDIVDVIEQMVQIPPGTAGSSGPTRYNLTRVSVSTQATRTNPGITGRPTEVWYDRQQAAPIANIWPLPGEGGPYTLVFWCLRRMDDAGAYTNDLDIPFRFLTAMIAGLAYYLAVKFLTVDRNDTRWGVMFSEQRIIRLHDDYEALFLAAADEDREKATLKIVPRSSSYRTAHGR